MWAATVLLLLLLAGAPAPAPAEAGLPQTLDAVVRQGGLPRSTGVSVRTIDGRLVYAHRARQRFVPASNEKLLTMAAALDALGPDYRFETTIVAPGPPDPSGRVPGPVYLVGSGDPTLSTAAFARRARLRGVGTIERLARGLRAAGVRAIEGGIVADASIFDARRDAPGWKAGFAGDECAPLSGLAVDRDRVRGTSVWQPERRAADLLAAALRARGIAVAGGTGVGRLPVGGVVLGRVLSPPLAQIVRRAGKESDNFTAEMLLKALGNRTSGVGSTAAGLAAARAVLRARGLDTSGLRLVDGSGLAAGNLVTPDFLARLLVRIEGDPRLGPALRAALAVAGVDGTLKRRLRRAPARGRVLAKTGTLRGVSALSGVVGGYAFSVVVNRRRLSIELAHRIQDSIALVLARQPTPFPAPPFPLPPARRSVD